MIALPNLQNIHLVVCDCDGTILNDDKKIDSDLFAVKKELEKKGIALTLASGRNHFLMHSILNDLDIQLPYITDNGGNLYQGNERLINNVLPNSRTEEIAKYLYAVKMPFLVHTDQIVFSYLSTGHLSVFTERLKGKMQIAAYDPAEGCRNISSFKITIDSTDVLNMQMIETHFRDAYPDVNFNRSEGDLYTITSMYATKGIALEQLSKIMEIPLSQIMAFGDNHNDVCMLKTAGFGVAVQNAEKDVYEAADALCGSNNQNGVSRYLREHFL